MEQVIKLMMTHFNVVAFFAFAFALSVKADNAKGYFETNKDTILNQVVTESDSNVFVIGKTKGSKILSTASNYSRAEETAKWNLGDRYKSIVSWPQDVTEEEKRLAWLEYRTQKKENFHFSGMYRIYADKMTNGEYRVVMCFPKKQILIVPPTEGDIRSAIVEVRKRKQEEEELIGKLFEKLPANSPEKKNNSVLKENDGTKILETEDVDLIL